MASKIVSRGYVVIYNVQGFSEPKVTAVVSGPEAEQLKRKVNGVIVPAKGLAYRMAQKTLRVLVDPSAAIARAGK